MPDTKQLTPTQRRELRAKAHRLPPVVMIGEAGLTPQVVAEIETAIKSHELIKVRVLGDDRRARAALLASICEATGAQPVQSIGKILVVYRPRPPEAQKPPAARRARRKVPRKTKRSYQNRKR